MHLTILRHATAEPWESTDRDSDRRLTPDGEQDAIRAGLQGKVLGWTPGIVLTSPYCRARRTAELLSSSGGFAAPAEASFLASGMVPEVAISELADYLRLEHVIIVGHEPDLSGLAGFLIGCPSSRLKVKPGTMVGIDVSRLAEGCGTLKYLIPPTAMRDRAATD